MIRVGDEVRWDDMDPRQGIVVAIHGEWAWVQELGVIRPVSVHLGDLEVVP